MIWNRKSLMLAAAGAATFCAVAGEASAMQLPNRYHYEQRLDQGQFGATDVVINRNGVATVTTRFTNAKPQDRDRFVARVIFRDSAGRPLATVEQTRTLDGAVRGRPQQAHVTDQVRLARPQWWQVQTIDVRYGLHDRGDRRWDWDHGRWNDDRRIDRPGPGYGAPGWRDPDYR